MAVTVPYDTISTTPRKELSPNCCFCIPLRIGCFILGYFNLLYNVLHTFILVVLFVYLGIDTHGFDHFDDENNETNVEDNSPSISQLALLMGVVILIKLAWLIINIICLVGIHKKRPGPIKAYVGFAFSRLFFSFALFVCLVMTYGASWEGSHTQTIAVHCIDLGISAHFIMVYYKYAQQLEREHAEKILSPGSESINDVAFIIPPNNDKEMLVV